MYDTRFLAVPIILLVIVQLVAFVSIWRSAGRPRPEPVFFVRLGLSILAFSVLAYSIYQNGNL